MNAIMSCSSQFLFHGFLSIFFFFLLIFLNCTINFSFIAFKHPILETKNKKIPLVCQMHFLTIQGALAGLTDTPSELQRS